MDNIPMIFCCLRNDASVLALGLSLKINGYGGLLPRGKEAGASSWPLTSIWCRG